MGPSERPENKEPRPLDGQEPRSRTKLSASRWKRKAVSLLRTAVEEEFYIVQSISSSGPKAGKTEGVAYVKIMCTSSSERKVAQ